VQAVQRVSTDYLGLERWAMETPLATALTAPDRSPLTYSEFWRHVTRTSDALSDAGVRPGSVIALAIRNGPELLSAVLAITLRSGCAPIELDLTLDECRSKLERINASTLIIEEGLTAQAADVARQLGMRIVHVSCSRTASAGIFALNDIEDPSDHHQGRQTDAALILMTSATTALPKLVPRSRVALRTAATYNIDALQLTPADRYLCCMPLIHSHGIGEALAQLAAGGELFCTPGFDAERLCRWLDDFRPTWFSASPAMHRTMLTLAREAPEVFRRTPLRFIRSSAAAPDPEVVAELESRLGVPILNGYGMTEVASATRNTLALRKPGSVGKSCGAEMAVMDDAGNILPPETVGEVVFRGPTVMSGYLDNPEANQAAFHNGWFRTGDLGKLDNEGFLFLVGRGKEMINRGGKKIGPLEVDQALGKHPAIADVATFAIPHRALGEDVAAAVVLRPGAEVSESDLRQFSAQQLSAYKIPRRIVFVKSIPRTTLGKPKRAALAEEFKDLGAIASTRRSNSTEALRAPTALETEILQIWRRILGVERIEIEDDFFHLGGDSLSAVLMLSQAEKTLDPAAGPMDASEFYDRPTVAALAALLTRSAAAPDSAPSAPVRMMFVRRSGARVPFFCFASRINPYGLRFLAQELGPDQPFIALCAVNQHRPSRVFEVARQSVAAIRAVRNHGPYLIGGYCNGGVLAFETARQLAEDGEKVALVALFDTPTPGYPKIIQARSRYAHRAWEILRELSRGTVSITARSIAEHLRALWRIATRRWRAKANRAMTSAGLQNSQPSELWDRAMIQEYTPQTIHAPVVHFLGEDRTVNATVLQDERLGWQDFAKGGFQTIRVPGGHVSMLAEANAAALAAELEEALGAALGAVAAVEPRRGSS
jgi:acyl-CoA synthetase (AMP-forming)/AMP-acid ligase II/thioesterase domain-containing protein